MFTGEDLCYTDTSLQRAHAVFLNIFRSNLNFAWTSFITRQRRSRERKQKHLLSLKLESHPPIILRSWSSVYAIVATRTKCVFVSRNCAMKDKTHNAIAQMESFLLSVATSFRIDKKKQDEKQTLRCGRFNQFLKFTFSVFSPNSREKKIEKLINKIIKDYLIIFVKRCNFSDHAYSLHYNANFFFA